MVFFVLYFKFVQISVLSAIKTIKKKKRLGAYPSVSVVFSITLSVLVMGILGVLVLFYQSQADDIKKHITIHIYLDKELESSDIQSLTNTLSKQKYVLVENGKAVLQFISKEEAAKKFIAETGEDFSKLLGFNPLRDAYVMNLKPEYTTSKNLAAIKSQIEQIDGIYEVDYRANFAENINNILPKVGLALGFIALILTIISIFLIHNTIRLALFSQRFLIRSMQLIGAKSSFIRGPFLIRALLLGILSGLIAFGVLFIMIYALDQYLNEFDIHLHVYHSIELNIALIAGMLLIGAMIGFFSTFIAVSKYLKMRLEDLY